ncbi:MAG: hypothetical protein QW674_08605 [Candidatus Bathyarchaeia archaeon]
MIEPELHDIGKFIDYKATGIKHNLEDYPLQLATDTWRGIVEHHCSSNFNRYPTKPDTFKLCIADDLASSFSRYRVEREKELLIGGEDFYDFSTHKLWNPSNQIMSQSFITSSEGIKEIYLFLAKNPTAEEFFARYNDWLKIRTEDATRGQNITSLYTHSKLTGQFFRILTSNSSSFSLMPEELNGLTREEVKTLRKQKENEWKLSIMWCQFNFAQTPVRAKDMNVFKMQESLIEEIKKELPDNVFFSTSNELVLIVPNAEEVLGKLRKKMEECGFWLKVTYAETQLSAIKPHLEKIQGKTQIAIYPELPKEISPPICELCQLSKAKEQPWIDEESGIREFICEKCWKIREAGSLLPKFVNWEKMEQNAEICWIKVWLDYRMLLFALKKLYEEYIKEAKAKIPKEIDIKFPIVSEFNQDYEEFLSDLQNNICKNFGLENIQEILPDFVAVKINSLSEIRLILSIYQETFEKYFPKFYYVESPLRLSIAVSNIKFPFSEVWRMLSDTTSEVTVHVLGKGDIYLKCNDIKTFLGIRLPSKALLHKLTQISEISSKLGRVIMYDKKDRDFLRYEPLRRAIERFGHKNVLTYAKIMSD